MKEQFRDWKPRGATLALLQRMQSVILHYQAQRIRMTLRQLYYQLVAANIITNQEKSYKKLSEMLTSARMAGFVDWTAIEDRVRVPHRWPQWNNISSLMSSAIDSFRLPRHEDQENYIELWAEKDAISSVLRPICDMLHVHIVVNRGYSSASAMYDASKRFIGAVDRGQRPLLLYLGDFDPSGRDMDRDIVERLAEFGVNVHFTRVGLTHEQIEQYHPPPNPAKVSDPRAEAYIAEFGDSSWEVDSLPPEVLNQIVTDAISAEMDMDKYNAVMERENGMKDRLQEVATDLDEEFGDDDDEDDDGEDEEDEETNDDKKD